MNQLCVQSEVKMKMKNYITVQAVTFLECCFSSQSHCSCKYISSSSQIKSWRWWWWINLCRYSCWALPQMFVRLPLANVRLFRFSFPLEIKKKFVGFFAKGSELEDFARIHKKSFVLVNELVLLWKHWKIIFLAYIDSHNL